jgi:hypothetical protein
MQPIGPLQPGAPQLPPPPQFPRSPQFPPPHPSSPQSQCPRPWPGPCAHSVPDATGEGGLAFATPASSPKAVKPSAAAIVASVKIFISFIVQTPFTIPRIATQLASIFVLSAGRRNVRHRCRWSKQSTCLPSSGGPSSHYRGWRADPPERLKAADSGRAKMDHFPNFLGGVRFCGLAWLVWLLVFAIWCAPLPARGSSCHPSIAQTATSLVPARRWSAIKPASVTVAATPRGHAAHASRWCTGRR